MKAFNSIDPKKKEIKLLISDAEDTLSIKKIRNTRIACISYKVKDENNTRN